MTTERDLVLAQQLLEDLRQNAALQRVAKQARQHEPTAGEVRARLWLGFWQQRRKIIPQKLS